MQVTSLQLTNFRSFEHVDPFVFGRINVFVGPNNAGKSSILRALHLVQHGHGPPHPDVRVGTTGAEIVITFEHGNISRWGRGEPFNSGMLKIGIRNEGIGYQMHNSNATYAVSPLPDVDPHHFIVPYLSKRKTGQYQEDVREAHAMRVSTDMTFLSARLSRLANPGFPEYERYSRTCKEILGVIVTTIPSTNGQRPGIYLPDRQSIPIDQMGEGVPNIVTLLAELALSRGKLFLIEEPENDLHPQALKALLDLIVESSTANQFVISTHSNIVVRHLASVERSKLYKITTTPGSMPPVAEIKEVEPTVDARLALLRELGYSFSDFDLWDGWLILEESSAERIIRDYLIPWFAPRLARIRTVAVGGIDQVEPTFDDFNRMVRFTHLEEAYRNAAWVYVDGDEFGQKIIERLRSRYPNWSNNRFVYFSEEQFERYYPNEFDDRVNQVLSITNRQERREAKRELLEEVRAWLDADDNRGRDALARSADEVIRLLINIEHHIRQSS